MRKTVAVIALMAALAVVIGALASGSALAYGKADQPIAQVELSGNCNNPGFWLCAPEDQGGVGTGGVWAWAELDTVGTNTTSGTIDFTFAGCGHTVGGVGGPGGAGGGGGPGEGIWYTVPTLGDALAANAFPFFDTSKYTGPLYVLDFFPGSGPDDFIVAVPAAQGHYAWKPANGVTLQSQVAP